MSVETSCDGSLSVKIGNRESALRARSCCFSSPPPSAMNHFLALLLSFFLSFFSSHCFVFFLFVCSVILTVIIIIIVIPRVVVALVAIFISLPHIHIHFLYKTKNKLIHTRTHPTCNCISIANGVIKKNNSWLSVLRFHMYTASTASIHPKIHRFILKFLKLCYVV